MASNLVTLQRVDTLENIAKALNSGHHSFPVLNAAGNLIGMIPRNFIIVLLQNKGYYNKDVISEQAMIDNKLEAKFDKESFVERNNNSLDKD